MGHLGHMSHFDLIIHLWVGDFGFVNVIVVLSHIGLYGILDFMRFFDSQYAIYCMFGWILCGFVSGFVHSLVIKLWGKRSRAVHPISHSFYDMNQVSYG